MCEAGAKAPAFFNEGVPSMSESSEDLDNSDSGGYLGAAAGDLFRPNSFRIPNR